MNKKIYALTALALTLMVGGCKDKAIEIVESDPTYSLDPKQTNVEKPTPFEYNENNLLRLNGSNDVSFSLNTNDQGQASATSSEVTLTFALRKPLAQAITVQLVEDRSLLESYRGVQTGFEALPEGVVQGLSFEIPAGQQSVSTSLSIANYSALTSKPGYLTAYRIVLPENAGIQLSTSSPTALYVKIKVSDPLTNDPTNAQLTSALGTNWVKMNSSSFLAYSRNGRNSPVARLTDGVKTGNTYYQISSASSGQEGWFRFAFPETKVVGFAIYTDSRYTASYGVATCKVTVANETVDGVYYEQGTITNSSSYGSQFYVMFNKPVTITTIKFSDFESFSASSGLQYAMLHEVELFTE